MSTTHEFHAKTIQETNLSKFNFEFTSEGVTFQPMYYPRRVKVGKERDVKRDKGICNGEHVKDIGTKNREIHVVGYVTPAVDPDITHENYINNMQSFHDMCDLGQRGDLVTMQWAGEVLLLDSDLDGPKGVDTNTGHFLYEYTLDFVSTGRDEMGSSTSGIVRTGEPMNSSDAVRNNNGSLDFTE